MSERARTFGPANRLVGVVTDPEVAAGDRPAVVVLGAGTVHHVGPSRYAVRLARRLAARGFPTARFDHGGVGDSGRRTDRLPWEESTVRELGEVLDDLAGEGRERFVLVGLCSGAITAFRSAAADPRVVGIALINAQALDLDPDWNRHVLNRGWSRQYWRRSLFSADSWKRALTGRIQYRRLAAVLREQVVQRVTRARVAAVTEDVGGRLAGFVERGGRALFVSSAGDHAEDYRELVLGAVEDGRPGIRSVTVEGSDHTFTLLHDQRRLLDELERWLVEGWGADARTGPVA